MHRTCKGENGLSASKDDESGVQMYDLSLKSPFNAISLCMYPFKKNLFQKQNILLYYIGADE